MTDEANDIPASSGPWPTPPTQGVTQFSFAMNLNEVVLTFGISRASMQPGPGGVPTPVLLAEWLVSLSLPPTVAKAMQESLGKALVRYEELFGKLPSDPNAQVTINDAVRPAG